MSFLMRSASFIVGCTTWSRRCGVCGRPANEQRVLVYPITMNVAHVPQGTEPLQRATLVLVDSLLRVKSDNDVESLEAMGLSDCNFP